MKSYQMSHVYVLDTVGRYDDYRVAGFYRVSAELAAEARAAIDAAETHEAAIEKTQGYGSHAAGAARQRTAAVRRAWAQRVRDEGEAVPFVELWDGSH